MPSNVLSAQGDGLDCRVWIRPNLRIDTSRRQAVRHSLLPPGRPTSTTAPTPSGTSVCSSVPGRAARGRTPPPDAGAASGHRSRPVPGPEHADVGITDDPAKALVTPLPDVGPRSPERKQAYYLRLDGPVGRDQVGVVTVLSGFGVVGGLQPDAEPARLGPCIEGRRVQIARIDCRPVTRCC